MASEPSEIAFFEIVPLPAPPPPRRAWAQYRRRTVMQLDSGANYREVIQQAAVQGVLPGVAAAAQGPRDPRHRSLDIGEPRSAGDVVRAYAFRLDARHEEEDLLFVNPPFIALPTNDPTSDGFIRDFRTYEEGGELRWASFVCDLGEVRGSQLARRVQDLDEKEHRARQASAEVEESASAVRPEHPASFLTLPFCFNVRASELEAAPWVVDPLAELALTPLPGSQDTGAAPGSASLVGALNFFTHGGVHPPQASFLVVGL